MLRIKFRKTHSDAVIPTKAHPSDAGFDLTAVFREANNNSVIYDTGISLEIPDGYVGKIYPRSSIRKKNLTLANSVGIIDAHYRGNLILSFNRVKTNGDYMNNIYSVGDRIGQLIIEKLEDVVFLESEELNETERGTGGFGSTGE